MGTPLPRFGPPKLAKSRGIEESPPRTPLTLREEKTPKSSPFAHRFGRGSKGKEPLRVQEYTPTKSQRERPRILHKKISKKGLQKSPKRRNGKDTSKP
jgi:hypothetical protein